MSIKETDKQVHTTRLSQKPEMMPCAELQALCEELRSKISMKCEGFIIMVSSDKGDGTLLMEGDSLSLLEMTSHAHRSAMADADPQSRNSFLLQRLQEMQPKKPGKPDIEVLSKETEC